jgi:hypothetical protein
VARQRSRWGRPSAPYTVEIALTTSSDGLAAQLLLPMDGAWVAARMFGPQNHATSVAEAARALINAHLAD